MKSNLKIGICGDVCSECPRYIATQNNDEIALTEVAKLWYRLKLRDRIVNPDEIKCNGCSKEQECTFNINSCEHLKEKNNCGECEYFPCNKIERVFKKTDRFSIECKNICSPEEYEKIEKAFLNKRKILYQKNHLSQ